MVTTTAGTTSSASGLTSTITYDGMRTFDPAGYATFAGGVAFDGGTNPGGGGDWLFQDAGTGTVTVDFSHPVSYVGFLWGTPDSYNNFSIYDGTKLLGSYNGSIANWPGSYENFFAASGYDFTSLQFSSSGCCFETDNLSYKAAPILPVPEGGSSLFDLAICFAVVGAAFTIRSRNPRRALLAAA